MAEVPPIHSCGYIHRKSEPCPGHISSRDRLHLAIRSVWIVCAEMHDNNEQMTDADVELWCLTAQHPAIQNRLKKAGVTRDHDEQALE